MNDLSLKWKGSNEEKNLFETLGKEVENYEHQSKTLNLDIGVIFKKTNLVTIANFLIEKIEEKTSNENIKLVTSVVIYSLLMALSLKNITIKFFNDNELRLLKNYFKETTLGTIYIDKEDLDFNVLIEMLDILCMEGIFEEENNKYYLIGHHLEHLECG